MASVLFIQFGFLELHIAHVLWKGTFIIAVENELQLLDEVKVIFFGGIYKTKWHQYIRHRSGSF